MTRESRTIVRLFTLALCAMSIMRLLVDGLGLRLGFVGLSLLGWHETFLTGIFSFLEPSIEKWLAIISGWTGLNLILSPQWHSIFVLMGVYFFRASRVMFSAGKFASAAVGAIVGVLIALPTSVFAAALSAAVTHAQVKQFVLVAIPITGVLLYDLCASGWNAARILPPHMMRVPQWALIMWFVFFRRLASWAAVRGLIGLIVGGALILLPPLQALPSAGLAVLNALNAMLAIYLIWVGTAVPNRVRIEEFAPPRADLIDKMYFGFNPIEYFDARLVGVAMLIDIAGSLVGLALDYGTRFLQFV